MYDHRTYICKHLLDHQSRNSVLTKLNDGFSYEAQLITNTHDLLKNHDIIVPTDIIFLECVQQKLFKWQNYGNNGPTCQWPSLLRRALTSDPLFLFCINNLPDTVTSQVCLFAGNSLQIQEIYSEILLRCVRLLLRHHESRKGPKESCTFYNKTTRIERKAVWPNCWKTGFAPLADFLIPAM